MQTERYRWDSLPRALLTAFKRFGGNHGFILSSHVAMSMMLALFPFMLFVVSLGGAVSRDLNIDDLIATIFGLWPDTIAEPIVREIRAVLSESSGRLITVGGVLAIYFASNGVDAVRLAVSYAYRETDPRPFWKTRLLCILFVVIGGLLLILALTIGLGLPTYLRLVTESMPEELMDWGDKIALIGWLESGLLRFLVTLTVLCFVVSACHIWLPGLHLRPRQIWPGVALTILLWIAGVWGFSIYINRFAAYSATYAGLAGAMAALIFLYLLAAILILGAEFNGALIRQHLPGEDEPGPDPLAPDQDNSD